MPSLVVPDMTYNVFSGTLNPAWISLAAGAAKNVELFTGSIARSANLPVFSLLKGRF